MKAASKKLASCFMLLIAMLPLLYALYIQTSQAIIHYQMHVALEQKNLVTIRVKSSDLIWTDKGNEARINGDMFDIRNYVINGNDIVLTGLFDKDEDALFTQIDNAQQNNNDATAGASVLKLFSCFQWKTNNIHTHNLSCYILLNPADGTLNNPLQEPFLANDVPPPKPVFI